MNKKKQQPKTTISFLLDRNTNEEFREIAYQLRKTRSEILREFVRRFVAENKGE